VSWSLAGATVAKPVRTLRIRPTAIEHVGFRDERRLLADWTHSVPPLSALAFTPRPLCESRRAAPSADPSKLAANEDVAVGRRQIFGKLQPVSYFAGTEQVAGTLVVLSFA
jgi:hypothetical protein